MRKFIIVFPLLLCGSLLSAAEGPQIDSASPSLSADIIHITLTGRNFDTEVKVLVNETILGTPVKQEGSGHIEFNIDRKTNNGPTVVTILNRDGKQASITIPKFDERQPSSESIPRANTPTWLKTGNFNRGY